MDNKLWFVIRSISGPEEMQDAIRDVVSDESDAVITVTRGGNMVEVLTAMSWDELRAAMTDIALVSLFTQRNILEHRTTIEDKQEEVESVSTEQDKS